MRSSTRFSPSALLGFIPGEPRKCKQRLLRTSFCSQQVRTSLCSQAGHKLRAMFLLRPPKHWGLQACTPGIISMCVVFNSPASTMDSSFCIYSWNCVSELFQRPFLQIRRATSFAPLPQLLQEILAILPFHFSSTVSQESHPTLPPHWQRVCHLSSMSHSEELEAPKDSVACGSPTAHS